MVHLVQSRLLMRAAVSMAPRLVEDLAFCLSATVLTADASRPPPVPEHRWENLSPEAGDLHARTRLQTTLILVVQGLAR